jgi:hypothetical protein
MDGDDLASFPFIPWPPEFEMTVRRAVARAAEDNPGTLRQYGRRYTARSLPNILHNAGLTDIRISAYADTLQSPLGSFDLEQTRDWFINSYGNRIREYLAPADWRRYEACFTVGDPECVLDQPGFFMTRTWFLGVGTVE